MKIELKEDDLSEPSQYSPEINPAKIIVEGIDDDTPQSNIAP
jgi:hypothetical protein